MGFDDPRRSELERQVAHWKANHDEMVARNQLLRGRRDLPMERRAAYKEITERLDNQKHNIEKLLEFRAADIERIRKLEAACRLVDLMFRRQADCPATFLGDDEHEAWNAVRDALNTEAQ